MSGDIMRNGLDTEKRAMDLYLTSMYDDAAMRDDSSAAVINLIPGVKKNVQEPLKESAGLTAEKFQDNLQRENTESRESDFCPRKDLLQVLQFNLSGLNMAISMSDLDRTVAWPEKLFTASDKCFLCLGVLFDETHEIPVIDLARVIVPERLREQQIPLVYEQIMITTDRRWGLACHGVSEMVTIESSAVNWRSERTSRKWLAGTISSYGSALLDVQALESLLQQSG